jgi:hypothetical protein
VKRDDTKKYYLVYRSAGYLHLLPGGGFPGE